MLHELRERPRRLLAVFPHPDDEAYGCAGAFARECARDDTTVVLLTLTRGEASSMFREQGLSPAEVGVLRTERMERVRDICGLDILVVRDLPDGGLARMPVATVAEPIAALVDAFDPQVVIGQCPRGVNGHLDHVATHWAVRHVIESRAPRRFAMVAYTQETADALKPRLLFPTKDAEIDLTLELTGDEIAKKEACLRVHEALTTILPDGDPNLLHRPPIEHYDLLGEAHDPRLTDLFDALPTS